MNVVPFPTDQVGRKTIKFKALSSLESDLLFAQVLRWSHQFRYLWASLGKETDLLRGNFPKLIAYSNKAFGQTDENWLKLGQEIESNLGFWFGIISYESGQFADGVIPSNPKLIDTPLQIGFVPEGICWFTNEGIFYLEDQELESIINTMALTSKSSGPLLQGYKAPMPTIVRDDYVKSLQKIKDWIALGETYELNYCAPLVGQAEITDPVGVFLALGSDSIAPFATLFKGESQYLFGYSPERFFQKIGQIIWSQPIKGTARRSLDFAADEFTKLQLASSEKERAENMMIVDLVRNDLARISNSGSVAVEEMMKVYSFPHVHQMISTIRADLKTGVSIGEVMASLFPMGSMTGAPKKRTMVLIDQLENYQRGWFSGTLGYKTPANDWDFCVNIRSLIYDAETNKLVLWAGGAITWDSDPDEEYQEWKLKTEAILNSLNRLASASDSNKLV
jgi:para-aminobenzoate synthetase component 1